MQTLLTEQRTEFLQGSVERVTFHSEESGFCVLRVKVKARREPVTVTGSAAAISAGEYIECQGQWVNDRKHGLQFSAKQLKVVPPTTLEGIEKYLGSGLIKATLFGVVVSAVGCLRGMQTGNGAAAVGISATRAVVSSIVLIVLVDGIFAFISYKTGF